MAVLDVRRENRKKNPTPGGRFEKVGEIVTRYSAGWYASA
jgi:hypothetical protein